MITFLKPSSLYTRPETQVETQLCMYTGLQLLSLLGTAELEVGSANCCLLFLCIWSAWNIKACSVSLCKQSTLVAHYRRLFRPITDAVLISWVDFINMRVSSSCPVQDGR